MKLGLSLLGLTTASHFRGGGLQYRTTDDPTKLEVTRYMGWSYFSGGYSGGCTQEHIDNQTPSTQGSETITGIGSVPATYIVSNIENSPTVDSSSHFCFGSYTFEIDVSSITSFDHTYSGCCTIGFQQDDGSTKSGNYGYTARVNDVTNSSPQFASPPATYLMKGCGGQEYAVAPVDPEGDTIRCRWSTESEAFKMAHDSGLSQFSLNEETCVVTYHPENDQATTGGSKAIAVQVEDFDADGNLLHSVPLGFIAVVSEPQLPSSSRTSPFLPGLLYAGLIDGDDNHVDFPLSRRRRSAEPAYCAGRPSFVGASPAQAEEKIESYAAGITIQIDWQAEYQIEGTTYTDIPRYQFASPAGMSCSAFDANGAASCTWSPTESQVGDHPHCVVVYDPYGRSSERRCVTIRLLEACADGLERVGKYCLPPCAAGWERDSSINCVDVDECATGVATCAATIETCANNNGGFTCPCSAGYERNPLGICEDIDECARNTDNCANTVETCANSVGSFTCPCASGFERNSAGDCVDVNECSRGAHSCAKYTETCVNKFGSFTCEKSKGYKFLLLQQAMMFGF